MFTDDRPDNFSSWSILHLMCSNHVYKIQQHFFQVDVVGPTPLLMQRLACVSLRGRGSRNLVYFSSLSAVRTHIKTSSFYPGLRIRITLIRIRSQLSSLMRIRIQLLFKVMGICDHRSINPPGLHFEPSGLHCESARPSTAPFWVSKDLEYCNLWL